MAQQISFNEHCGGDQQWIERYHEIKEKLPYELACKDLVHFTENESVEDISKNISNFEFCAKSWKPNENGSSSISFLSWWSALPPASWRETVDNYSVDIFYKSVIGNSAAFMGESVCGPVGFVVPWKDALKEYAKTRNIDLADIELRILGTFRYRAEIMYGILICGKNDIIYHTSTTPNEEHQIHAKLENETEAFRRMENDETFIWKVYSTIGFSVDRPSGVNWTWDHLTFAFYFPEKDKSLIISSKLCRIVTKKATEFRPHSRGNQWDCRSRQERKPDKVIVRNLETEMAIENGTILALINDMLDRICLNEN